jgi:integrase
MTTMSKRRGHGGGSIQQRGESSYRLRYYVGEIRHTVTFRGTKKEADVELRRLLGDADKGVHIAPDKKTLAAWSTEWIALKAAERQHKTVGRYEDLLKKHVLPKLGERPIQQIKPIEIQKLYAEIDLSPRTKHHIATVLKACRYRQVVTDQPGGDHQEAIGERLRYRASPRTGKDYCPGQRLP